MNSPGAPFEPEKFLQGHSNQRSGLEALLSWLEDRKAAGDSLPYDAVDLASLLVQIHANRSGVLQGSLGVERAKFQRVAMLLKRVRFIGSGDVVRRQDRRKEIPKKKIPEPEGDGVVVIDLVTKFQELLKIFAVKE